MDLIKTVMNIGQRVRIIEGATQWMQKRGFWSGIEVESIDGLKGRLLQDYTSLGGDFSHYSVKVDGIDVEIGINPQWLVKA
jgi:hypothetical protein